MSDRQAEIQARVNRATPGRWRFMVVQKPRRGENYPPEVLQTTQVAATYIGHQVRTDHSGGVSPVFDGEFIAHAREDVQWLLAELSRVQPPPASGDVENLLAEKDRQIETLTQALKGVKSIQRGYLCWCDGSWNNVEHGHQPKCQKATEAISGASRPTEGEQPQQERERMQKKIEQLEAILKAIPDCPMCKGEGWLMEEDGGICPACDGAPHIIGGTGKLTAKPPQLGEQGAPQ